MGMAKAVKKTVKPVKKEAVNHPQHYNMGSIEVIDAIEDWQLDFHIGNAVKYLARALYKENAVQDLNKACWCIQRKISLIKKKLKKKPV
jgi:hypothetical protein